MSELDIQHNRSARKYSRKEMVYRVLWMLGSLLFRLSFRNMFAWRAFLLRIFGAKVGTNVHIYNSATIYMPWNFEIGDESSISEHAFIYNLGRIRIGSQSTVSHKAHLCAGTHDYSDPALPLLTPSIEIGDKVWVCADAFVGPGVTIEEGSVVGARAVVMKNVGAYQVVAGNPATTVKVRHIHN